MNLNLFQHCVDGYVGASAAHPCAAVNDDGAAVRRVCLDRLPDVPQNRKWVARHSVVGPAGVVELLDLALAD